jgi:hypothetical protein
MPEYRYKAIDDNGKPHKGTMAADSETHLEEILNKGGYYLLEAAEVQAIVKSTAHKPDIVDPKEEGRWQWGKKQGVPPGVTELHLHQHVYYESESKKKKELTFWQKLTGEKICPNCERIVRPIMRIGWFWVIVLSIITFPIFLIFYAVYYTFFKRKECPICAHRFFLLE